MSCPTNRHETRIAPQIHKFTCNHENYDLLLLVSYNAEGPRKTKRSSGGRYHQELERFSSFLLADSTQLDISMAMVIGPTPPGTGVIMDATGSTCAKSTSPQSLFSAFSVNTYVNDNRALFHIIFCKEFRFADGTHKAYRPGGKSL